MEGIAATAATPTATFAAAPVIIMFYCPINNFLDILLYFFAPDLKKMATIFEKIEGDDRELTYVN